MMRLTHDELENLAEEARMAGGLDHPEAGRQVLILIREVRELREQVARMRDSTS